MTLPANHYSRLQITLKDADVATLADALDQFVTNASDQIAMEHSYTSGDARALMELTIKRDLAADLLEQVNGARAALV